jgi:hypothetical protein
MSFDGRSETTGETTPGADPDTDPDVAADQPDGSEEADAASARIETLEAENERLRRTVEAARRRQYRYTALGLGMVGLIALAGAVFFAPLRDLLVALGFTGLFGAVLTYFLTPERFVSAAIGERIYTTLANNEAAIVEDLMLGGEPLVYPTPDADTPARLFVPQVPETVPADDTDLSTPFTTGEVNGLSLDPTGAALYAELRDAADRLPGTPPEIATVVGEALVEQFELVDAVDVDGDADRVTMAIDGSAYGPPDRFDHPVSSLLATTLAAELEATVTPTVESGTRAEWLVTCRID